MDLVLLWSTELILEKLHSLKNRMTHTSGRTSIRADITWTLPNIEVSKCWRIALRKRMYRVQFTRNWANVLPLFVENVQNFMIRSLLMSVRGTVQQLFLAFFLMIVFLFNLNPPIKYRFLKGMCEKNPCLLSHDTTLSKMPTCKFYLQGMCSKTDCPYLHKKVNDKTEICVDFLRGFCAKAEEVRKLRFNMDKRNIYVICCFCFCVDFLKKFSVQSVTSFYVQSNKVREVVS